MQFQSTHPRRVRLYGLQMAMRQDRFQSTHPRRVRPNARQVNTCWFGFQSTHPRRVRQLRIKGYGLPKRFQSTHPRRVRQQANSYAPCGGSFNPRTHVGCDADDDFADIEAEVSIHAPT